MKKTIILTLILSFVFAYDLAYSQVPEQGKIETTSGINLILGTRVLTTKQNHNLIGSFQQTEVVLSKNRHWEGGVELFHGYQFHPNLSKYAGGAFLLKYNFMPEKKIVPFIAIALGGLLTNAEKIDIDKKQNFSLQGGVGVRYYVKKNAAITIEERWWHVSNGSGTIFKEQVGCPNNGMNGISTILGVTWTF